MKLTLGREKRDNEGNEKKIWARKWTEEKAWVKRKLGSHSGWQANEIEKGNKNKSQFKSPKKEKK